MDATTTIYLAVAGERHGRHQVFGAYDGPDDRYTFGVREFADAAEAERAAERLAARHGGVVVRASN